MALLAGSGLAAGVVLLALTFRWGLMLILDPQALPQLQSFLATPLTPQPVTTLTKAELQETVTASGQVLGDPVQLTGQQDGSAWLIFPIASAETGHILNLRVFQQTARGNPQAPLTDVATVTVSPFSAEEILAPFTPEERQKTVTPPAFGAQQLTLLPSPPEATPYRWLTLEGQWSSQGTHLRYGQILIFDSARRRLDLATVWSSPSRQLPQWVDLDGEGFIDLAVNETTGMEPSLRGLKVVDRYGLGPNTQLQPVSWVGVPFDAGAGAHDYQQALRLARNGLWREAHTELQRLKAAHGDQWNPTAEAQLRLAARHATLTQQQAQQDWSLPNQKVIALMIDSQWTQALATLEASPTQLEPIMRRLAADQGPLWNRISAAASLTSAEPEVFVWGGLALEAQQNRQAAQQWLDRQRVESPTLDRLKTLWTLLDEPAVAIASPPREETLREPTSSSASNEPTAVLPASVQGVIGQVVPLPLPLADDWYFPDVTPPALVEGEQWYAVEVPIIRSEQQWQAAWPRSITQTSAALLWSALPFTRSPSMTMVRWESSTLGVTQNLYVKGLKLNGATVTLLAAGTPIPQSDSAPIAFSDGALVWLSAKQQTTPSGNAVMTPLLDEMMRHQGPLPEHVGTYAFGALLQEVKLHTLDLTGDGQIEQVLTFDQPALDQLQGLGIKLDSTAHKTVILNAEHELIYSDLFQPQTMVALTNPNDGFPIGLVIHRSGGYGLLQWSQASQKFLE